MTNTLLTKVTSYGLNLVAEEIKNKATRYILIGSSSIDDKKLIQALEDNDVNNNLTYAMLSKNNWIGYEGNLLQKYYDSENFLTFDFEIPTNTVLNIFVYGFAILDITSGRKEVISITRSPSIFNKVKDISALFSIKMTFGQDEKDAEFRSNLHNSIFVKNDFLFLANGTNGTNIISSDDDLNSLNIGMMIKADGIPDNTVIIETSSTNANLNSKQVKISQNLTKDLVNEAVFLVKTFYRQSDFVTKAEFNSWQKSHNHNDLYYLKNERVVDSSSLNGKSDGEFATKNDLSEINKKLNNKIDRSGGNFLGSIFTKLKSDSEFRENEFTPLFLVKKLIEELKNFVQSDYDKSIDDKFHKIVGRKNFLETDNKENIVSAVNELRNALGTIVELNYQDKDLVKAVNHLIQLIGNNTTNDGQSLADNIKRLDNETAKLNTESTFTINPKIIQPKYDMKTASPNDIMTKQHTEYLLTRLRRSITIDLTNKPGNKAFPLVLNEYGERKRTDTVIYNEVQAALSNSLARIRIVGTGACGTKYMPELSVSHSTSGPEGFIKKVYMPSQSSAIIVYLRGGVKYYLELNGSDSDPILVENDYRLDGTANIILLEDWLGTQKLQAGNWLFNQTLSVTITNKTTPHFIYDKK